MACALTAAAACHADVRHGQVANGDVVARDTLLAATTTEPLILGPPVQVIDSLPDAWSVTVGTDGRYYVGVRGPAVIAVEPTTLTRTTYPDRTSPTVPGAGGAGVARDKVGRVYLADSVDSAILVIDPADSGSTKPRPVLTGLDRPADVTIDAPRDRLIVLEASADRLAIYDLP